MADNVTTTAQVIAALESTSAIIATDEVGGAQHQYVKLEFGADGTATKVSASDPLPVTQTTTNVATPNVDGTPVQVGTGAAVTVLAAFATRKTATIIPEGDVYMRLNGTAANTHAKLPAYTPYNITGYSGSVSMLSVSGTINVNVWEF